MTVAGCLVVAGAVLAVPLGLAALALWWNWLGTMGTGGALAQVLFSFALCGLLLWLGWRGVVRPVWGVVAGPLTRAAGRVPGGRVRPRPDVSHNVPTETSPAPNVPLGTDAGPGTFPGHVGHVHGARDEGQRGEGAPPPPAPGRQWLVEGLVPYGPLAERRPRGYITALVAERGTGKSVAGLHLALTLLSGRGEWWGLRCRHAASVVYADLEMDGEGFWERADALARGMGLPSFRGRGLSYLNLYGHSLTVPTPEEAKRARGERHARWWGLGAPLDAACAWGRALGLEWTWGATGLERLALRCRRVGAQAAVVDSLTLGSIDTALNETRGWNRELSALEALGIPIIGVDHLGKAPGRGGQRAAVGSFLKEARFRSVLTLRRERSGALVAEHTKSTFGPALPARRVQDAWTTDDRGRLVAGYTVQTAAAPAPAPAVAPQPQPVPLRVPAAGRAALRLVPSPGAPGATQPEAGFSSSSPALRGGEDDEIGALSGHDRIDAAVLKAARAHRGQAVPRALVAQAAGYTVGVAASSLSRLKKRGLVENVGRGEWRATPAGEEADA